MLQPLLLFALAILSVHLSIWLWFPPWFPLSFKLKSVWINSRFLMRGFNQSYVSFKLTNWIFKWKKTASVCKNTVATLRDTSTGMRTQHSWFIRQEAYRVPGKSGAWVHSTFRSTNKSSKKRYLSNLTNFDKEISCFCLLRWSTETMNNVMDWEYDTWQTRGRHDFNVKTENWTSDQLLKEAFKKEFHSQWSCLKDSSILFTVSS